MRPEDPQSTVGRARVNCITCRFAGTTLDERGDPLMECHRFPPRPFPFGDEVYQSYPTVREEDWCGEYQQDEAG